MEAALMTVLQPARPADGAGGFRAYGLNPKSQASKGEILIVSARTGNLGLITSILRG